MARRVGSCASASRDILHAGAIRKHHEKECGHAEQPEISSDEADEYVRSVHEYQNGEIVQVLSHTAGGWVEARVAEPAREGCHTVEFTAPGHGRTLFRKHVMPTSQHLRTLPCDGCNAHIVEYDPGCSFPSEIQARAALDEFIISIGSPRFPAEEMPRLSEVFHMEHKGHNAFKASFKIPAFALSGLFCIAYNPKGNVAERVDMVLKVHALPEDEPDEKERYKPVRVVTKSGGVVQHGFVHTLMHQHGEKVVFDPQVSGPYYLGFTVNKDLSVDLCNQMKASQEDSTYFEGLFERFKLDWQERCDVRGEALAEDADYIISYTARDKDASDEWLRKLSTNPVEGPHNEDPSNPRPIKFCTDRSLGFGMHFHPRGAGADEIFTLNLGKHGFAQPLEPGTWWDEWLRASQATKCGILTLDTLHFFFSKACCKEFTGGSSLKRYFEPKCDGSGHYRIEEDSRNLDGRWDWC